MQINMHAISRLKSHLPKSQNIGGRIAQDTRQQYLCES